MIRFDGELLRKLVQRIFYDRLTSESEKVAERNVGEAGEHQSFAAHEVA